MTQEQEMFQHVNRWKESGLTIRSYSQQEGLSYHSLYHWIKKQRTIGTSPIVNQKEMFIELSSPKENFGSNPSSFSSQSTTRPQVELTFPSGLCLRIFG